MGFGALRTAPLVAAFAIVACTGDDPEPMSPGPSDASIGDATVADAAGRDGGDASGDEGLGDGTTFADLYADFFAPAARASCAGDGRCHGSASAPGASASGFVCSDEATCLATMTGASGLVSDGDRAAPADARLVAVLRHVGADGATTGFMPKRPEYVFSTRSMKRIEAWIGRGAPAR